MTISTSVPPRTDSGQSGPRRRHGGNVDSDTDKSGECAGEGEGVAKEREVDQFRCQGVPDSERRAERREEVRR